MISNLYGNKKQQNLIKNSQFICTKHNKLKKSMNKTKILYKQQEKK